MHVKLRQDCEVETTSSQGHCPMGPISSNNISLQCCEIINRDVGTPCREVVLISFLTPPIKDNLSAGDKIICVPLKFISSITHTPTLCHL